MKKPTIRTNEPVCEKMQRIHLLHLLSSVLQLVARGSRELVATVLPALAIALFVNVFVAEAALVENGPSMQPNLYVGYRVMTEKITYRLHAPRRGDVIIAERPTEEVTLIKRVVGLPGETVEVRGGHTTIDGQQIPEPWVTHFGGRDYGPAVIPPEYVFIMGDNRANSRDSREIGPVPMSTIKCRVLFIYWPLDQFRVVP